MKTIDKIIQKTKSFGKKSAVFAVMVILMASIGTAALLSSYGTVNSQVQVNQSIEVIGSECSNNNCHHDFGSVTAGNTYTYCDITVKNNANSPIPVRFNTVVKDSGSNVVSYATVKYLSTVVLENKDSGSGWQPILGDGTDAKITFEIVANDFNYDIEVNGLASTTGYSLIYYADKPDRFVNWGGNNPGALIGTFTTDGDGNYSATGLTTSLGMDMPYDTDANYDPTPNYCNNNNGFDNFDLCAGAKLWIVPTSALPSPYPGTGAWNFWTASGILYETDLITYDDKDETENYRKLFVGHGQFEMCVEVTFHPATPSDTYTINMSVATVV